MNITSAYVWSLGILAVLSLGVGGAAAEAPPVTRLPAPGGEVIFANPEEREVMYDQLTYAAARRAGDFVFLAGVEIGPLPGEGTDAEAFKVQLRRGFQAMANSLAAAGATFSDVVQMQTFHNCNTPSFQGDLDAQAGPIIEVKKEFMPGPYSTWTAVCVVRHYSPNTVVEIQLTAYAPLEKD